MMVSEIFVPGIGFVKKSNKNWMIEEFKESKRLIFDING